MDKRLEDRVDVEEEAGSEVQNRLIVPAPPAKSDGMPQTTAEIRAAIAATEQKFGIKF